MQILSSTKIIFALVGLLFVGGILHAEEEQKMKAAYELFETMEMGLINDQTVVKMVDIQIQQKPQIKIFRKTMLQFMNKYLGWENLKEDIAKIYVSKFTLDELIELKKFYQTPVGRKSSRLLPELTAAGAELGQKRVQQNIGELKKMIAEEAKRLKKQEE
jgi:hypothetical protein